MFIAALFIIAKLQKQCPSMHKWIKQMFYTHTHTHIYVYTMYIHILVYVYTIYMHVQYIQYYSAIKKKEILPFATTWMDLKAIILSEISQTEEDKYSMISLTCGTYNEQANKQNHAHRYREQIAGCQKWG